MRPGQCVQRQRGSLTDATRRTSTVHRARLRRAGQRRPAALPGPHRRAGRPAAAERPGARVREWEGRSKSRGPWAEDRPSNLTGTLGGFRVGGGVDSRPVPAGSTPQPGAAAAVAPSGCSGPWQGLPCGGWVPSSARENLSLAPPLPRGRALCAVARRVLRVAPGAQEMNRQGLAVDRVRDPDTVAGVGLVGDLHHEAIAADVFPLPMPSLAGALEKRIPCADPCRVSPAPVPGQRYRRRADDQAETFRRSSEPHRRRSMRRRREPTLLHRHRVRWAGRWRRRR